MLIKTIEDALNNQIKIEAESSQYYLAMASWAETSGLNGTAKFLYMHSDEERMHMLKLVKFVNERGGNATIPALTQPPKKFQTIPAKEASKTFVFMMVDLDGLYLQGRDSFQIKYQFYRHENVVPRSPRVLTYLCQNL